MPIADIFAAQLEDLKRRSEESDRVIAQLLEAVHQLIDQLKAMELGAEQSKATYR